MMGINQEIPPVKELWKNEKSKYRHWVIILAVGLIVITSLTWTSFILDLINKDSVIENIKSSLKNKQDSPAQRANDLFIRNNVVIPSFISVITLTGVVWYFASIINVYRHENFANLSRWPTLIIGSGAVISFISLILFLLFPNESGSIFSSKSSILIFATRIIYILIYFAASAPISRVRRIFLISDHLQKLKKDQNFQKMTEQFNNAIKGGQMPYGPFGPVIKSDPNSKSAASDNNQKEGDPKNDSTEQVKLARAERLKALPIEKLRKIAEKLSISGYKSMNKDELIEAILRIFQNR